MSAILFQNSYGKSAVRILKVSRSGAVHKINEYTVAIKLEGDFETAHTTGDNSKILPTDTMKNTVYAFAKSNNTDSPEDFASGLGEYFLKNNEQVTRVTIEITEKMWKRIHSVTREPHPHSFISGGNEKRFARVKVTSEEMFIESGIRDLVVLKTTRSAFENFIKDKYTTLKETNDRIFSTSITADWVYENKLKDFNSVFTSVRDKVIETFADHNSLSVQQTLFETGKNVIDHIPEINQISLSMPNKHYLLFNLEQFGMENKNEIFIPTDEPYGLIEAIVKRNND